MVLNKTRFERGLTAAVVIAGFMALVADPGFARGNGMGNGNGHGHMNAQGPANEPDATDRDFGRDRAEDRAEDRANANANLSGKTHGHFGQVLSTSTNAGGSATANAHRWRHGRHHHYGWRAR